jgi:small-conductance mechanosensitive channel
MLAFTMPSNLEICLKTIVSISSMNIIPKEWVKYLLNLLASWTDQLNSAVSDSSEDDNDGYAKNSFFKNLGQVIFAGITFVAVIVFLGGLHFLAKRSQL